MKNNNFRDRNYCAFFTNQKLHFDRCSRTDKGVSAVQQLVSLKIGIHML